MILAFLAAVSAILTVAAALALGAARREHRRAAGLEAELRIASDRALRAETRVEQAEADKAALGEAIRAASAEAASRAAEDLLKRAEDSFVSRERLAQSRLEGQLKPVADQLEKLTAHVSEVEAKRISDTGGLKAQIGSLLAATTATHQEASRLATVLRRGSGVQGRWGEQMLDNVLEMSGLRRGVDYEEQRHVRDETGAGRPDVVVRLPGGGVFVIDSKVSLTDYFAACQASGEDERSAALDAHLAALRRHVGQLSSRAYWQKFDKLPDTRSPDIVAMFVPIEGALACLADQHPSLIADAWEKKVAIVTPTALFPMLRAVHYGWRAEDQANNAREIAEVGRELHQRLSVVAGYADALGRALDGAVKEYNQFGASIERNVLSSARRLEKLSARSDRPVVEPRIVEAQPRAMDRLAQLASSTLKDEAA